jgi:tetratricopeptide (TPR) repeat protein
MRIALVLSGFLLFGQFCRADDLPYTPATDDVVLEKYLRLGPLGAQFREQQRALQSHPQNVDQAVAFARASIESGNEEGDPRYFGYAQTALAPWWDQPNPPAEVRLLRATILQWQHKFDAARLDLDAVIAADDKGVVQAHLTRATVLMVQGEPDAARHDCAALVNHTEPLIAATCIAAASSLMGRAVAMEAALTTAVTQTGKATPAASEWAYTELAEINDRLGRIEAAGRYYEQALQIEQSTGHRDPYLLASYADFLLDQGENARVVAMLDGLERIDNLLLRLALAETALGHSDPAIAQRGRDHAAQLQQRFDETRARGDFVHQREEAIYMLKLAGQPARAVAIAQDNWTYQRELTDARILVDAARAAHDAAADQSVKDWVQKWHVEDVHLEGRS